MDKQTQQTLRKITRDVPAELTNITKVVTDTSQEDSVKAMIRDPRLPAASRRKLRGLVERGAFRTTETIVDEEKIQKLDEYHTNAVRKARESGQLADPTKDPFNKKRLWLQRNRPQK